MRIKITLLMSIALGLSGVVFGQHNVSPAPTTDQSITGAWIIHFQAGHDTVTGKLYLQADGERLTGTVETGHTGPGTVQDGKWSKQKISANLVFPAHETVFLEGELKSDGTLAGNYKTEGRTETWRAERSQTSASTSTGPLYSQYQVLIGTWDVTAREGGAPFAVQRFSWGPGHSYIWYAGSFITPDGTEQPHFEGMLVWNGA